MAFAESCRCPFANAIDRKYRSILEWAGQESAGSMREVMFREHYPVAGNAKMMNQQALDPKLVLEPREHRFPEDSASCGEFSYRRRQNPFKLEERLLEKYGMIDFFAGDPGLAQTECDGTFGEFKIVLLAAEPFLLGGRNQLAIAQQRCRGIVKET